MTIKQWAKEAIQEFFAPLIERPKVEEKPKREEEREKIILTVLTAAGPERNYHTMQTAGKPLLENRAIRDFVKWFHSRPKSKYWVVTTDAMHDSVSRASITGYSIRRVKK